MIKLITVALIILSVYPAQGIVQSIPTGSYLISIDLEDKFYRIEQQNNNLRYTTLLYDGKNWVGEIFTAEKLIKWGGELYTIGDLYSEFYTGLFGFSDHPTIKKYEINGIQGYIGYGQDVVNPSVMVWGVLIPHKLNTNGTLDGITSVILRTDDSDLNERAVKSAVLLD